MNSSIMQTQPVIFTPSVAFTAIIDNDTIVKLTDEENKLIGDLILTAAKKEEPCNANAVAEVAKVVESTQESPVTESTQEPPVTESTQESPVTESTDEQSENHESDDDVFIKLSDKDKLKIHYVIESLKIVLDNIRTNHSIRTLKSILASLEYYTEDDYNDSNDSHNIDDSNDSHNIDDSNDAHNIGDTNDKDYVENIFLATAKIKTYALYSNQQDHMATLHKILLSIVNKYMPWTFGNKLFDM